MSKKSHRPRQAKPATPIPVSRPTKATPTALQEGSFTKRFLERYGLSLTDDEIRLVQAYRGLPAAQRTHLAQYASGLVVEHVSVGRVREASRELFRYFAECESRCSSAIRAR